MTHTPAYYWLNELRMDEEFPLLAMVPVQMEASGRDPGQTKRFIATITAKLKQRYPDWQPGSYNNLLLQGTHAIRFNPGEFPAEVEYNGPAPSGLTHYELITVPGGDLRFVGDRGTFLCVSREWAEAINACEPDVHEMHPVKLVFSDHMEIDRVILRTMLNGGFMDFESSDLHHAYELHHCPLDVKVSARKTMLQGKHWVNQHGHEANAQNEFAFIVSANLLDLLRPLIPSAVHAQALNLI